MDEMLEMPFPPHAFWNSRLAKHHFTHSDILCDKVMFALAHAFQLCQLITPLSLFFPFWDCGHNNNKNNSKNRKENVAHLDSNALCGTVDYNLGLSRINSGWLTMWFIYFLILKFISPCIQTQLHFVHMFGFTKSVLCAISVHHVGWLFQPFPGLALPTPDTIPGGLQGWG